MLGSINITALRGENSLLSLAASCLPPLCILPAKMEQSQLDVCNYLKDSRMQETLLKFANFIPAMRLAEPILITETQLVS